MDRRVERYALRKAYVGTFSLTFEKYRVPAAGRVSGGGSASSLAGKCLPLLGSSVDVLMDACEAAYPTVDRRDEAAAPPPVLMRSDIGYPLVPRTESVFFGHGKEVNGRAHLWVERCPVLVISNLVSPGSSGRPVLIRDGQCVGITINWLEDRLHGPEETERMRFSAALPAVLLRDSFSPSNLEPPEADRRRRRLPDLDRALRPNTHGDVLRIRRRPRRR